MYTELRTFPKAAPGQPMAQESGIALGHKADMAPAAYIPLRAGLTLSIGLNGALTAGNPVALVLNSPLVIGHKATMLQHIQPIEDGDVLEIVQAYSVVEDGDILEVI